MFQEKFGDLFYSLSFPHAGRINKIIKFVVGNVWGVTKFLYYPYGKSLYKPFTVGIYGL